MNIDTSIFNNIRTSINMLKHDGVVTDYVIYTELVMKNPDLFKCQLTSTFEGKAVVDLDEVFHKVTSMSVSGPNNIAKESFTGIKDDVLIRCIIDYATGRSAVHLASRSEERLIEFFQDISSDIIPREVPEKSLEVNFWSFDGYSGDSKPRTIEAPTWSEIGENYPLAVRKKLNTVMNVGWDKEPNGKLILWHGDPGLGKTYALRALLREWSGRDELAIDYIMDPEIYFNNPSYMSDILMSSNSNVNFHDEHEEYVSKGSRVRPHLLIIEDAGELLSEDAKDRTGQGLSRLLNLVDGLIGQGLNFRVLMTTNEKVDKFHPAVTRSGRCMQILEFEKFSSEEATRWLKNKGCEVNNAPSMGLSDLYNELKEDSLRSKNDSDIKLKFNVAGQYL